MLQGQIIKPVFGVERYCHVLIFHAQTVMVGRNLEAPLTSGGWDQSLPEEVLDLISCTCNRSCSISDCSVV